MNTLFPLTGSETEWNAAYYRLEDYSRSLRFVNKVHQSQILGGHFLRNVLGSVSHPADKLRELVDR
jgi:hypothetical protein